MTRSCLFVNTYYPGFLDSLYRDDAGLANRSYDEQMRVLQDAFFGDSDFYSRGLRDAGWRADDVIVNCKPLQSAWARENGAPNNEDETQVLRRQIQALKPDVVYIQDLNLFRPEFLREIKREIKLLVGQIATPMKTDLDLSPYAVVFSSFPHYVERFRKKGVNAYYQPLAFEERVWKAMSNRPKIHGCTFVGGISGLHLSSYALLDTLAKETPIQFWGYGRESLPADSPVRASHHGEAWGRRMMEILAESRVTINRHGEVAENYANNMRLFEATGVGALLITDYKDNLHEMFELGKEIVAFRTPEECAALVNFFLAHPEKSEAIAKAGQARTLREHTYTARMRKAAEIMESHLNGKPFGQNSPGLGNAESTGNRLHTGNRLVTP